MRPYVFIERLVKKAVGFNKLDSQEKIELVARILKSNYYFPRFVLTLELFELFEL